MAVTREIVPPPGAAGAEPHPTVRAGARWRRVVAIILVVLFGILAPLGLVAGWARATLLDTDRYVETVAPLASNGAIQHLVTDVVAGVITERVDPMVVSEEEIVTQVDQAVSSDTFARVWREANRVSHGQLVALLTGERVAGVEVTDGAVTLDLSTLVADVRARLTAVGISVDAGTSTDSATITIVESGEVGQVQEAMDLLDRVASALWVTIPVLAVAAVVVAPNWWRAVRRIGIALAISMAISLVALVAGRMFYLDALDGAIPQDAAAAVFDVLTRFLWIATVALLALGGVTAAMAFAGERRRAGRRAHV